MRATRTLRIAVLIGLALLIGAPVARAQEARSLFDGKTLKGWKVTNFGGEGTVEVEEGVLVMNMGDPMTGITLEGDFPKTNYEFTMDAKRVDGNDFFAGITFPVKDSFCSLILGGWGGGLVGLSSIDGADASENATRTHRKFEDEKWYHVRLRVTDDSIRAWVDDDQVVDFAIDEHELGIRVEVSLSRPFGIANYRTTSALKNLSVREIK